MDIVRKDPLSRFPGVRTQDVGELRQRLSGLFSVRSIDIERGAQRDFDGHLNHCELPNVGLSYARYGAAVTVSLAHTDVFLQGFPLRGGGSLVVDGSEALISRGYGAVGGPGAEVKLKYSPDFENLIVRITPQALTRKLSALLGRPVDPPLRIATDLSPDPAAAAAQFRLVEFVVGELDRNDAALPPLVLAELEQALIVAFLCSNHHNYSHLLGGQPLPSAPRQVRRVEEYVEQNWDQPITIEALALVANTSVRSLFYSFKKSRGVSPMTFVKQVRMRHARTMLANADPATSVTSVAFACGFSNLGHFAKYYYSTYGERPSDTLRMAVRGSGSE